MNEWMGVITKAIPNSGAKFALIGSVYFSGPPYLADWNAGIIDTTDGSASAYTMHWYLDSLPYCGSVCDRVDLAMMPAWFEYVETRWVNIVQNLVLKWPSSYEIWATEYNLFDYNGTANKPGVLVGSWAHGLLFAQQSFYMMSSPQLTVLMAHAFDWSLWAAFLNISTPTKEQYSATPFGVVFGQLMHCAFNATSMAQLSFSPQLFLSPSSTTHALIGYQFITGGQTTGISIVNLSNQTAEINVAKLMPLATDAVACTIFSSPTGNMFKQNIVQEDLLTTNCENITATYSATLPPYSYLGFNKL